MSDEHHNQSYRSCGWRDCELSSQDGEMIACPHCEHAYYCSKSCRRLSWPYHVFDCNDFVKPEPIHYLVHACEFNYIPIEPRTRELFKFDRVAERKMEQSLLGLYQGLISTMERNSEFDVTRIEEWAEDNLLIIYATHIYTTYEPYTHYSQYYKWFRKNRWVFDDAAPVLSS